MRKHTYEEVKQLRDKGLSVIEIARIYKVTRQRVYQLLDKQYNASRRKLYTGVYNNA